MGRTYNVIDSDGHVLEPRHFWREYIDPQYRDRAPDLIVDDKGKERFLVEGKLFGPPAGLGLIGGDWDPRKDRREVAPRQERAD